MRRCVVLIKTNVSEERIASNMRVKRISELGTLTATSNWNTQVSLHSVLQLVVIAEVVPSSLIFYTDDGGDAFLRNVGSYKSHAA
jgi:hypothetical protein